MYWVRILEESRVGRAAGSIVAGAIVVGVAWHSIGALVRWLF